MRTSGYWARKGCLALVLGAVQGRAEGIIMTNRAEESRAQPSPWRIT